MTTLVGIQGPDFFVMAADTQITEGTKRTTSTSLKIFEKGDVTIGISGDIRGADILRYHWQPPALRRMEPEEYAGKKLVPSIINAFDANSYDWNNTTAKDKDDKTTFAYLVGVGGKIFELGPTLELGINQSRVYAVGSGGDFALGYLQSVSPKFYNYLVTSMVAAEKALRIASELDVNTSPPIQVIYKTRGK